MPDEIRDVSDEEEVLRPRRRVVEIKPDEQESETVSVQSSASPKEEELEHCPIGSSGGGRYRLTHDGRRVRVSEPTRSA